MTTRVHVVHRGVRQSGWWALVLSLMLGCGTAWAATTPPSSAPSTALDGSAALRATVFGTPPQDIAPLPERVPIAEINLAMPWAKPVPPLFWFARKLRVWFSAQPGPAPLAIVISGTGSDGNTRSQSILRGVLYGAGYHVLTLPSPTFPGFIVSTSSTGVSGDLFQDGNDLYQAIQRIIGVLPDDVAITGIDILGYSLGGANAAIVKSIDAREGKLGIRRAVMINPPVSLFSSIDRLDRLFATSIGDEAGIERLYQKLYAQLGNLYRASGRLEIDQNFLLGAAAAVLRSDREFAAAIALTFRLALVEMFFVGDLYAKTGIVVDAADPPGPGDSLESIGVQLRTRPFAEYFAKVFAPYYLQHRRGATRESLIAQNSLQWIGETLHNDPDYHVLTNADDLILDREELAWLRRTFGSRIVVYPGGGHLGNLGERQQMADLLAMLAGNWHGGDR